MSQQSNLSPRRLMQAMMLALWLGLGLMVVLGLLWQQSRKATPGDLETLQVLGQAPDFALQNRDQRVVMEEDLLGMPWVADFVFTSCPGVCPVLSKHMKELATDVVDPDVRWVSFSVDPETDTPEVLQEYAEKLEADDRWLFLTGTLPQMEAVIREGFKVVLDTSPRLEGAEAIVHSNRFVLVDAEGKIRGYYNAFEEQEMLQLRRDLSALLAG